MDSNERSAKWKAAFWWVSGLSLCVKLGIALRVPLTGDEAYYVMWGKYPALGYYDQPPMIGWMLAVMRIFGTHRAILRLPAILLSSVLGVFLVDILRRRGPGLEVERRAYLGGILFLLAPIHFLLPILSTDVPLVFFSFLGFYFFHRALSETRQKLSQILAAGAGSCLGLAFLSKYFVILLIFSLLIYFFSPILTKKRVKHRLILLGIGFGSALPFLWIHLYWNAKHCWINFVFNTSSRNVGATVSFDQVLEYLRFQLILIGPVTAIFMALSWNRIRGLLQESLGVLASLSFLVPLLILGVCSFQFRQGFHWTLSFYSFLYVILALLLSEKHLQAAVRWSGIWTALVTASVLVVLSLPVETWSSQSLYPGLKTYLAAPQLSQILEPYQPEFALAADGYTEAALLEATSTARIHVFGEGVVFGRQDDLLTDFRQLSGKSILIFTRHGRHLNEYEPYFEKIVEREIEVDGKIYRLFLGHQFKYPVYRDRILALVRHNYYSNRVGIFNQSQCPITGKYFDLNTDFN